MKIDTKKGAEAFNSFLQKTADAGKKAAGEVQKGAIALSEKAKQDSYARRLQKFNPLFPDVYQSPDFCLPNMIVIVDDAVRRGIDVCEGAIGWRSNQNGMEVLHLYDEAVSMSGIHFVPAVTCDAVYYVDRFDRNRYIRTDCIFDKAHEERIAELEHIAHFLGAKSCSIEICEISHQINTSGKSLSLSERAKVKSVDVSSKEKVEQSSAYQGHVERCGRVTAEFKGSDSPRRPKLKWFAYDDTIKRLIDARCKDVNTITAKTLELSGSSSATMSQNTARVIDGAIGKLGGANVASSMESKAIVEHSRKLYFHVQF